MAVRKGVCQFCGCDYWNPCPLGCGWADRAQTVCTECVTVQKAFRDTARAQVEGLSVARRLSAFAAIDAMRRAFFIGFAAGSEDERSRGERNPYARGGKRHVYWALGAEKGRAQSAAA